MIPNDPEVQRQSEQVLGTVGAKRPGTVMDLANEDGTLKHPAPQVALDALAAACEAFGGDDPADVHDAQEIEAAREEAGEIINLTGKTMLLDEMNGHLAEAVAAIRDKFPNSTRHDVSFEVSDGKVPQWTISFTAPDVEWCIASGSTLDEAISRTIKRGSEKMDQVKRNMSEAAVLMSRVADLERKLAESQRLNAERSGQLKATEATFAGVSEIDGAGE